jgi:hypothetical protein
MGCYCSDQWVPAILGHRKIDICGTKNNIYMFDLRFLTTVTEEHSNVGYDVM